MWGSGDPILEFWDSSNISRKVKARNFKFETVTDGDELKIQNWVKRGHVGSRDPILEFWDPPNISRTVEARNIKFGTETDGGEL